MRMQEARQWACSALVEKKVGVPTLSGGIERHLNIPQRHWWFCLRKFHEPTAQDEMVSRSKGLNLCEVHDFLL